MLWIDVTDIRFHLMEARTVTGIQRASIEIIRALEGRCDFRLVEFNRQIAIWQEVPINKLADVPPPKPRGLHKLLSLLRLRMSRRRKPCGEQVSFQTNDQFLSMGAFWFRPEHADCIHAIIFEKQMKQFLLIYDLIPITHAEWFGAQYSVWWARQYDLLARQASKIFAISKHTAHAIATHSAMRDLIPEATVIRLGDTHITQDYEDTPTNLVEGPFVLCVSTIDIRKNQKCLIAVWRKLVHVHGATVPKLVLVGKMGPLSSEFLDLLHKSPSIRDHVVIIDSATDDDLKYLYKSCLFTVFPTRAEGWGLPVAESLVFGKACIASRVDSIPEVGQTTCEYVEVDNTQAWYEAIERFIFDGHSRRRLEERIALEFKPTPWSLAADDILSEISK